MRTGELLVEHSSKYLFSFATTCSNPSLMFFSSLFFERIRVVNACEGTPVVVG